MLGRTPLTAAALLAALIVPSPATASSSHLTFSGFGHTRLGASIAGGKECVTSGGVVVDDFGGRRGRVNDVHTSSRGISGPFGVRAGMTDRALRRALGRRSVAFKVGGLNGRRLVGPKGHTVWALETRKRTVGEIGVAISKRAALSAAKAGPCVVPPSPTNSAPAQPSTDAPSTQTPAPDTTTSAPAPTTPPVCPATLPSVGPYMRVACDASTGNRVQYTCHPDWRDTNHDPSDGCETEKDGLQLMWFHQWSALAFNAHIWGGYSMNGYAAPDYPNQTTDWDVFPVPGQFTVQVPSDCSSNPTVACPGGQPADPPPTLSLDLVERAGDADRSVINPTGTTYSTGSPYTGTQVGQTEATGTARFRLKTNSAIPFTYNGNACTLAVDSAPGSYPDVTLTGTLDRAIDPDTGDGADGPPKLSNVTITNLEPADYSIQGPIACTIASYPTGFAANMITPALTNWYRSETHLCATSGPHWWEPCPSSVHVSW